MSAAQNVLDRLHRVKQTQSGKYITACPCCQSKSGRPLNIRELDDGRVLIHAFCGCETEDVLGAIGLTFADLFDKPLEHWLPPIRGGFSARELLEINAHEATVAMLLVFDAQRRPLTAEETQRLAQASERLTKAQGLLHAR